MRSESSFATARPLAAPAGFALRAQATRRLRCGRIPEDKRETRERRERAREKARLKASERGRFLAFQNDREKDLSPARLLRLCFAKRPKGRSIFAAPLGDWRESNPSVRPSSVVPPMARRGGVWGRRSRSKTPLQFRSASCDRFAARASPSGNPTPSARANLAPAILAHPR